MATDIFLDFDDGAELDAKRLTFLLETLNDTVRARARFETKRGHHIALVLAGDYPPVAVVAIQAILGSDPRREIFNVQRALTLASVPVFWRHSGRWNTLYSEKLERSESRMINPNDFGTGRPALKIEALGDADVAVWRIAGVEEITINQDGADRPKLLLTVEEFPELAYWCNVTGIKTLVGKLGENEQKWIGKQVPFVRATTNDPRTHKQVEALWIAAAEKWDELLDQFAGRRGRPRVSAGTVGKMGGAKRAKKAAAKKGR